MFLIPVGVEGATLRRIPWASILIAALCLGAFVVTWVVPVNPEAGVDVCGEALDYLGGHPYLEVKPEFLQQCFGKTGAEELEELRREASPPSKSALALEQVHFDQLSLRASRGDSQSTMMRLAVTPRRGPLQWGWLTAQFLHAGWLHLLGNLLFFYIVGPLLEQAWGSVRFALFYLLGGALAFAAQAAFQPSLPIVGASGSIACCIGAFTLVHAREKIRMGYLFIFFIKIFRGTFLLPAWLWGLTWGAFELLDLYSGEETGVAVMAHVAGFGFGLAVAATARALSGGDRSAADARSRHGAPPATTAAIEALYAQALADLEAGSRQAGMHRLDRVLRQAMAADADQRVVAMVKEVGPAFAAEHLSAPTALQLSAVLERGPSQLHPLAEELLTVAARSRDAHGAKALMRLSELGILRKDRSGAPLEHLRTARKIPGLDPALVTQIDAIEPRAKALAPNLEIEPDPAEARRAPLSLSGLPPRIVACRLKGISPGALALESAGRTADVKVAQVLAVSAALATQPGSPGQTVLVTDLVLNAGDARVGPTVLRIDGASLSLATLFPGLPAREAFSRLLAHLLQQGAQALPDRDSLERGAFRTFPSIAALDAAVWGPR